MIFFHRSAFFTLAFFTLFWGNLYPAHAGDEETFSKLTENAVENFINETTAIMSGQNTEKTTQEMTRYLERHLEDKARFKSVMRYNIPGHPTQESAMSLSKRDFIDNIQKGAQTIKDYQSNVTIKEIRLSSDRKNAIVLTEDFESGTMPVPVGGGQTEFVPVEGASNCTQIITLGKKGIIQMYGANCTTEIQFQSY